MKTTTLIVPGLRNSGQDHWQSWFESKVPNTRRVNQAIWDEPKIIPWARNVQNAILDSEHPVILVAHSFGVIASIVGGAPVADRIAGALFVAPADPSRFTIIGEKISAASSELQAGLYNHIPKENLGYPSIVAASLNDPCISFKRATWWATTWRSKLVCLGNVGHVNVASGHGVWPNGLTLYEEITKSAQEQEQTFTMAS